MNSILRINNITKIFEPKDDLITKYIKKLLFLSKKKKKVIALNQVSLSVEEGEILGIVGESGCGKSTFGKIISGIVTQTEGDIFFKNYNLNKIDKNIKNNLNLKIQMVFQDPYSSLNPRKRVKDIILEAPLVHNIINKNKSEEFLNKIMNSCGLSSELKNRFPHEFSGGQKQRIAIARSLAVNPDLLICDEIVSALDVSVQAQILNLILELKEKFKLTTIFISHDLSVVRHVSDRVAVMYLGRIVELGSANDIFLKPIHSYTKKLLNNLPNIKDRNKKYLKVSTIEDDIEDNNKKLNKQNFNISQKKLQHQLYEASPGHWVEEF